MNLPDALTAVIDALRCQRATGVNHIYLDDDTLANLRMALNVSGEADPPDKPSPKPDRNTDDNRDKRDASIAPVRLDFPSPPTFELPEGDKAAQMDWLRRRVQECPVCQRHLRPEKQLVMGVGDLDAELFFCGEAPGAEEEVQGEPFIGPAGQLLTRMIEAMGLKRPGVYIGNIMNWRPETAGHVGNRPPSAEEMAFCLPYLKAQLTIVQPKVVVALGLTAANGLLGYDAQRRMSAVRGQWQRFEERDLMVTYHPSYLLRNASKKIKRLVWEDLLKVMERLNWPISVKQRSYFSD